MIIKKIIEEDLLPELEKIVEVIIEKIILPDVEDVIEYSSSGIGRTYYNFNS